MFYFKLLTRIELTQISLHKIHFNTQCKGYQELGGQGDQRGPKGLRSLKGLEGGFIDDGWRQIRCNDSIDFLQYPFQALNLGLGILKKENKC